jgi:hypothetical protein
LLKSLLAWQTKLQIRSSHKYQRTGRVKDKYRGREVDRRKKNEFMSSSPGRAKTSKRFWIGVKIEDIGYDTHDFLSNH